MALNPDKSDPVFIGSAQRAFLFRSNLCVAVTNVPLASKISILGAKLDSSLTLDNHTNSVSCFYHIRALRQIRVALSVLLPESLDLHVRISPAPHIQSLIFGAN